MNPSIINFGCFALLKKECFNKVPFFFSQGRRKKGQVCSYGYESSFLHRPKEFKPSMGPMKTGKKILNAFSTGMTNGQTEGFNKKIKAIKWVSYGYRNFENFKSRILMVFRT
nr:transposase [Urinicoccus massiliensis]